MLLKFVLSTLLMIVCAASSVAQNDNQVGLEQFDFAKIQGRWIVTSIEIDGELTSAQTGQQVGDVISIDENMPASGRTVT